MASLLLFPRDHAPNFTLSANECTLDTCSLIQAQVDYDPNLGANVFFAALFGLLLCLQIIFGVYYHTWTFTVGMVGGLILELCGYIGRVKMHYNPFIQSNFFMYLISLTIGPTWLSASLYVCFSRVLRLYNPALSRLSPGKITAFFITSDIISLILQAGGGAMTVEADDRTTEYMGIHIMLAGLVLQVFSLTVVLLLAADFAVSCWRKPHGWVERFRIIRERRYFRLFLFALLFATIFVLIRSIFRVAELAGGFHGTLWNTELDFLLLDGMMMAFASVLLTAFHPGLAFHGRWESVKKG